MVDKDRPVTGPSMKHMTFGWMLSIDRLVNLCLN